MARQQTLKIAVELDTERLERQLEALTGAVANFRPAEIREESEPTSSVECGLCDDEMICGWCPWHGQPEITFDEIERHAKRIRELERDIRELLADAATTRERFENERDAFRGVLSDLVDALADGWPDEYDREGESSVVPALRRARKLLAETRYSFPSENSTSGDSLGSDQITVIQQLEPSTGEDRRHDPLPQKGSNVCVCGELVSDSTVHLPNEGSETDAR